MGSKQRFYIAAQGPTKLTLPCFWQCVWEAEVYLLVQLTEMLEDIKYLPNSEQRCVDVSQVCLGISFRSSMLFVFFNCRIIKSGGNFRRRQGIV